MAKFEEEKVITALHPEMAEVGKKYYVRDVLSDLKRVVEAGELKQVHTLIRVDTTRNRCSFYCNYADNNKTYWDLLYPYEEPPKQRMTNRQLAEWLAKGNGVLFQKEDSYVSNSLLCCTDELNDEVAENIVIHSWDSEEWIEPTVDIYERDCKGGKKLKN